MDFILDCIWVGGWFCIGFKLVSTLWDFIASLGEHKSPDDIDKLIEEYTFSITDGRYDMSKGQFKENLLNIIKGNLKGNCNGKEGMCPFK